MKKTKLIVRDALLLALLVVSAFIKVSVFTIPFTMQYLVVVIIALVSHKLNSLIIFSTYLVMGLMGIFVFAEGGGISYLFNPSFGFILGFIVSGFVINLVNHLVRLKNLYLKYLISSISGLISLYIVGFCYALMIKNIVLGENVKIVNLLEIMILPFILIDILKCFLTSYIAFHLKKINNGSNIF